MTGTSAGSLENCSLLPAGGAEEGGMEKKGEYAGGHQGKSSEKKVRRKFKITLADADYCVCGSKQAHVIGSSLGRGANRTADLLCHIVQELF